MKASKLSRREFLVGCSSAIAALAGARLTQLAFASPAEANAEDHEILVVVFLRGGWDVLNVVPPISGADRGYYEEARPGLKVPSTGEGAALDLDGQFGLHPAMGALYDLYGNGNLAIVHAVGLTNDTRSHFDAMQYIELGTPESKTTASGWITRHMESAPNIPATIFMPSLAAGSSQPGSLLNDNQTVVMNSPGDISLAGHWNYLDSQRIALRRLYDGNTWLYQAGTQTLNAVDLIESLDPGDYVPSNGAVYPETTFGRHLQGIAQMIRMDLGLRVATVDLGGWDTHENQGAGSGGYLEGLLGQVSNGLSALYTDLDGSSSNYASRLTMVVMSEFGRRLKENNNLGTDHGHGSVMLVMGGQVNGGKVYGNWPGLAPEQLFDGADLDVTTDYRQVLCEILMRRLGNPNLMHIFPGLQSYQPLGIVKGEDTSIIPTPTPPATSERHIYVPLVVR
jgi:uncharacterized protein (DUF1501 family)